MGTTYKITVEMRQDEEVRLTRRYAPSDKASDEDGYLPQTTEIKPVTTEIYTQITSELDLFAVILAVNEGDQNVSDQAFDMVNKYISEHKIPKD